MSCWILSDKVINDFLVRIRNDKSEEEMTEFGRKCIRLNFSAFKAKYGKDLKSELKERLDGFRFRDCSVSKYQAFKSLECFLYQCDVNEKIARRKLIKELKALSIKWAFKIAYENPEVDKADWG